MVGWKYCSLIYCERKILLNGRKSRQISSSEQGHAALLRVREKKNNTYITKITKNDILCHMIANCKGYFTHVGLQIELSEIMIMAPWHCDLSVVRPYSKRPRRLQKRAVSDTLCNGSKHKWINCLSQTIVTWPLFSHVALRLSSTMLLQKHNYPLLICIHHGLNSTPPLSTSLSCE